MIAFIVGFFVVILSKTMAVRIAGLLLEVLGMFIIIADERAKCHKQTCPGCYDYQH